MPTEPLMPFAAVADALESVVATLDRLLAQLEELPRDEA